MGNNIYNCVIYIYTLFILVYTEYSKKQKYNCKSLWDQYKQIIKYAIQ